MSNPSEREFLDKFLRVYELENDPYQISKIESPDFLLKFPHTELGLEITEIFKKISQTNTPAPKKAIESGWKATLKETEKIWESLDHPNIGVDIYFNDRYHVSKHNYKNLASEILNIIKDNLPPTGELITINSRDFDQDYFPKEVDQITVSRRREYKNSYWYFSDGGVVPTLTINQVQEAISKKNEKHKNYLKKCDSIWLLIIVHGWRDSSFMDISDELIQSEFKSPFDKTLLFHTLTENIYDLNTVST